MAARRGRAALSPYSARGADAPARRQEGRYEDAFDLYNRALEALPSDARLLCNCAATHLRLGDHRKVRRALELRRAVDLSSGRLAFRRACVPSALRLTPALATRQALDEATRAELRLRGQDGTVSDIWLHSLAKAYFIQVCTSAAAAQRARRSPPASAGRLFSSMQLIFYWLRPQSNAALEMGNPALACSRLAMAAKLAPYDTSVSQKLDTAVRCLSTLFACLPRSFTDQPSPAA